MASSHFEKSTEAAHGGKTGGHCIANDCGTPTDGDETWKWVQERMNKCKNDPTKKMCNCLNCSYQCVDTTRYQWVMGEADQKQKQFGYTLFAADKRVKGIECPLIWEHTYPDYWECAWEAANLFLPSYSPKGLAINSCPCRDRHQLHIHLCSLHKNVQDILEHNDGHIPREPASWSSYTLELGRTTTDLRKWRVFCLSNPHVPDPQKNPHPLQYKEKTGEYRNLFQVLLHYVVGENNTAEMINQSLVVGVRPNQGFYIVNGKHGDNTGSGTNLLYENCC